MLRTSNLHFIASESRSLLFVVLSFRRFQGTVPFRDSPYNVLIFVVAAHVGMSFFLLFLSIVHANCNFDGISS